MAVVTALIAILIVLLAYISYFIERNYNIWKRLGVPSVKPQFPYGIFSNIRTYHLCETLKFYYDKYKDKGPMFGFHILIEPAVMIMDLDLLKNILIRDFDCFYTRQFYYNEKKQPLTGHMFATDGPKWKNVRVQLTPTFTSGKMKFMFPRVVEIGKRLQKRLNEITGTDGQEIEMKDVWSRFTTDVIGSCVFGIECNSLKENDALLHMMGQKIFQEPKYSLWVQFLLHRHRRIGNLLGFKQMTDEVHSFFYKTLSDVINYRENSNEKRNDFLQLLLDVKNNTNVEKGTKPLTFDEAAAEAFVFYVAGFETSSTLLSFCSYELGINQEIQEKARQEVQDILTKYENVLTYEALSEMVYIDQVLNEAMRKYPPLSFITRGAISEYTDKKSGLKIPKNCAIYIPIYAIHNDPVLYPNPDAFDPERFTQQAIKERNPMAFIPFGGGPRACIGLRFGLMQAKIALALVLLNFKFELSSRMSRPLKLSKKHFIISGEGGIFLDVTRLNQ